MSSIADKTKGKLKDFSGYTSLHGLGRIGDASYVLHKLFWSILFLGSFGFCMFQVYRLGAQYVSYPISTTLTVSQEEIEFPSITICNLNLVKYAEVLANPNLFQVIETIANADHTLSKQVNLTKFSLDGSAPPNYTYAKPLILMQSDELRATEAMRVFNARVANLTDKEMSTSYTDPTEFFIIECKFNGKICNQLNFTRYRDDEYGLCHQFNVSSIAKVPGRDAGLEVLISVQQAHYTPYMTKSSGIRGAIHPTDQSPNLKNQGFSFPTGFEIDVEMKAVTRERIPGPNKRCDDSNKWKNIDDCVRNCTMVAAAGVCGCTIHRSLMNPEGGIEICLDNIGTECFARELEAVITKSTCDMCMMPCKEKFFENDFSMTKFPSKKYEPVLEDVQARVFDAMDFKDFRDDLLLLRAYFPSLITESVVEERSYTEENFVSDIGGQLGLWIGMSVLSFTEIVELIVILFVTCCKRPSKTSDSTTSGDENSAMRYKDSVSSIAL